MRLTTRSLILFAAALAMPLQAQVPRGGITVHVRDRTIALSPAALAALPRHSARLTTDADTGVVSGVALWDVLERAAAVSPQASA